MRYIAPPSSPPPPELMDAIGKLGEEQPKRRARGHRWPGAQRYRSAGRGRQRHHRHGRATHQHWGTAAPEDAVSKTSSAVVTSAATAWA